MGSSSQGKKKHIFPPTTSAIYLSRFFFWYELPGFGDICYKDACLLLSKMGLNGTRPVVLKAPKNTFEKSNASHSRNLHSRQ